MSYVRSLTIRLIAALVFAGAITNASTANAKAAVAVPANCLPAQLSGEVEAPKRVMQSGISLSQAVAMMQAKYGAKSMRATTTESGGRVVHEIRLRSADGSRVWTVYVDAASGREM